MTPREAAERIERLQAENAAIVAERDEWMAARNQWCQRAQRMGQRAAKAESERDALREQHDAMAKVVGKLKDMLACPASYKSRMNMLEDIRAIVMEGKEFETADGELLVEAYADIDALKQQLAERDDLRKRAELAELLCRARGDMERVTEAEYEKLLAERDAEIERLQSDLSRYEAEEYDRQQYEGDA